MENTFIIGMAQKFCCVGGLLSCIGAWGGGTPCALPFYICLIFILARIFRECKRFLHGSTAEKRAFILPLPPDHIDFFEQIDVGAATSYLEGMNDAYCQAVPCLEALLGQYGGYNGEKMYSARDLSLRDQPVYCRSQRNIYDINDERPCFDRKIQMENARRPGMIRAHSNEKSKTTTKVVVFSIGCSILAQIHDGKSDGSTLFFPAALRGTALGFLRNDLLVFKATAGVVYR